MKRDPKIGVHQRHCCKKHGCKYGDTDCPVYKGNFEQDHECEECDEIKTIRKMTASVNLIRLALSADKKGRKKLGDGVMRKALEKEFMGTDDFSLCV